MDEANDVVVLFAGALGDALLALPAFRLLRARHAARTVVLGLRTPLVALLEASGCADRIVAIDDAAMARFLGGGPPPAWWRGRPALFSWFGGGAAAVRERLSTAAAAPRFLSVERGSGPRHAAQAYAEAIGEAPSWETLCSLGHLDVPAGAPQVEALAPTLVLHRGAGAPAKRWSGDGFATVAAWWRARGGTVLELVGPAEQAGPQIAGAQPLVEQPLLTVAAALTGAQAFVGNDSGPSHLAAAVGVRGVMLFGPTDPARWRPLSTRVAVLRAPATAWHADGFALPAARAVIEHLAAGLP